MLLTSLSVHRLLATKPHGFTAKQCNVDAYEKEKQVLFIRANFSMLNLDRCHSYLCNNFGHGSDFLCYQVWKIYSKPMEVSKDRLVEVPARVD